MKTRKEQLEIELAFEKGAKIEVIVPKWEDDVWSKTKEPEWNWTDCDYRIKEEPQRVPFDGTDAFNLTLQKFNRKKDKNHIYSDIVVSTSANGIGVKLDNVWVNYQELAEHWLKWNDLQKVWEECSKVK